MWQNLAASGRILQNPAKSCRSLWSLVESCKILQDPANQVKCWRTSKNFLVTLSCCTVVSVNGYILLWQPYLGVGNAILNGFIMWLPVVHLSYRSLWSRVEPLQITGFFSSSDDLCLKEMTSLAFHTMDKMIYNYSKI